MATLLWAIFLISIGFVGGWRLGYKQVTEDFEQLAKRVLNQYRKP